MKQWDAMDKGNSDQLAFRVAYLIAGFLQDNLTETEHAELDEWVEQSMDNQRLFEEMIDPANRTALEQWKNKLPVAATLERLNKRLEFSAAPKKSVLRSLWPYIAAAVIIAGVLIAIKWFPGKSLPGNKDIVMAKDLAPGSLHARLTLADGSILVLDSTGNGTIARQGNSEIAKMDSGLIGYKVTHPSVEAGKETFNTLEVPAGGQYQLVLPDGSKVWLNAGSSLRYPTVFTGKKRSVTLTGEAYFEVAKDPMFPFEVKAGSNTVTVLGTHFNINAYNDEPLLKISLAEGAVRVNNQVTLQPGEQAQINAAAAIKVEKADLETTLAWKNGLFIFKQASLEEVMRQVGRWYNCDIKFEASITTHFNAVVNRNTPVSNLLSFLEGTGHVHFRIGDNTITVLP